MRTFNRAFSFLSLLFLVPSISVSDTPGNLISYLVTHDTLTVSYERATVRLIPISERIIKIAVIPGKSIPAETSFVVVGKPSSRNILDVKVEGSTLRISSPSMSINLFKRAFGFDVVNTSGKTILKSGDIPFEWTGDQSTIRLRLERSEHLYGFGERGGGLDLRGKRFRIFNRAGFYEIPPSTMNINIPFWMSSSGYGILVDNIFPATVDAGAESDGLLSYTTEGGSFNAYVIAGPDMKSILSDYTWLTGRQPLPPKWALGYIQSFYGYKNAAEAMGAVDTCRMKGIPLDALILDYYWFADMGDLSWDSTHWSDPSAMMHNFSSRGVKTLVIEEPYFSTTCRNFSELSGNGLLAKDSAGSPFLIKDFFYRKKSVGLLDITNPDAQAWLWKTQARLFDLGQGGVWSDLVEPENHPLGMQHFLGNALASHNIYPLLWAKTLYDNFRIYHPNERFFNVIRSGFAGMQRYSVFPWTGDVKKSFGALRWQPMLMLQMGLSGVAYTGSDAGGFTQGPTTPELFARWVEYASFSPLLRPHSKAQHAEPWAFGPQTEEIVTKYIKLRQRLLPYTYTYARLNSETGMPLARPLVLEYSSDSTVTSVDDEYLFGESILVAPVLTEGGVSRNVYFPSGEWIDYWSDSLIVGPQSRSVAAPLDHLPLYIKNGAIIPMQQVMDYVDQSPRDTISLEVYPYHTSTFTMYDDDGVSRQYETGKYSTTTFGCMEDGKSVTVEISPEDGSFAGQSASRLYLVKLHRYSSKVESVNAGTRKIAARNDSISLVQSREGWWFDKESSTLLVKVNVQTRQGLRLTIWGGPQKEVHRPRQ